MPRTRSLAWSQLKVGILAVAALVLAAVFVMSVGGQGFSWQQYRLKTRFTDIVGLKTGAVVRVAGVEVGTVDSIEFVGAEVEVVLQAPEGDAAADHLATRARSSGRSACSARRWWT